MFVKKKKEFLTTCLMWAVAFFPIRIDSVTVWSHCEKYNLTVSIFAWGSSAWTPVLSLSEQSFHAEKKQMATLQIELMHGTQTKTDLCLQEENEQKLFTVLLLHNG